jgi:frataxin-like iron-binding protein CyaY
MYLIDLNSNRLKQLNEEKFNQLNITERYHLQEWIVNEPNAFAEELLFIQKEFDKFNDTNERLDLLALDKAGNIVVIENKLDDSGRNVTWQALKYASYCSTLSKEEISNIYQSYLDREGKGENAREMLSQFFEKEYEDIFHLNQPQTQRMIFVANNFRKEVTSTVLWLLNYKLRIQCFKVTPYSLSEQKFITFEQIIPQKDSADFIIRMAEKTQEDVATQEGLQNTHLIRLEFWSKVLPLLKGKSSIFQNVSPSKDHWLSSTSEGFRFTMTITRTTATVLLEFSKPSKDENKFMFDQLEKYKVEIESRFGHPLIWKRNVDKISSQVYYALDNVNIFEKEDWQQILNFLSENMIKLEDALKPYLKKIK